MTRGRLLARLGQDDAGRWVLWVEVPGVPSADQPSTVLGAGDGPSVAARTAALAGLGFEPARPGEPWTWGEVAPGRRVELVGTMAVGAVAVSSPPAPRRGATGAAVSRTAAKTSTAAARQADRAAERAAATRQRESERAAAAGRAAAARETAAAARRAAVSASRRPALDAPAGNALPTGSGRPALTGSRAAAVLPAGADRRPIELEPAPLALEAAAPRPRTVLDELLTPRTVERHPR